MSETQSCDKASDAVAVELLFLQVLGLVIATPPEFLETPENITVLIGHEGVNFTCHIRGDIVFWTVDGVLYNHESGNDYFLGRGVRAEKDNSPANEQSERLIVKVSEKNNGTNVTCQATVITEELNLRSILSGPAFLHIYYPLSAPNTTLEYLRKGTVLRLSWTEPAFPASYPITYYNTVVYNGTVSTDNVLVDIYHSSTQRHYDFKKPKKLATCRMLILAASATSDISTSNISTDYGMFPRIPDVSNLNISHEVVLVDGLSHLTVWFQEPTVCPLQKKANYTLEVLDEHGLVMASSGLLEARGGSDGRVVKKFTGLSPSSRISLRLTFMHSSVSWTKTVQTLPLADKATSTSLESTTVILITVITVEALILC